MPGRGATVRSHAWIENPRMSCAGTLWTLSLTWQNTKTHKQVRWVLFFHWRLMEVRGGSSTVSRWVPFGIDGFLSFNVSALRLLVISLRFCRYYIERWSPPHQTREPFPTSATVTITAQTQKRAHAQLVKTNLEAVFSSDHTSMLHCGLISFHITFSRVLQRSICSCGTENFFIADKRHVRQSSGTAIQCTRRLGWTKLEERYQGWKTPASAVTPGRGC